MKYIRQLGIILLVSFLGELLHYLLPLPVPASIYGIVLLFAALETRLLKADAIRETSAFLLEIMPMLFVPAGVGLLEKWDVLRPVWRRLPRSSLYRRSRCSPPQGAHAARDASAPETGG